MQRGGSLKRSSIVSRDLLIVGITDLSLSCQEIPDCRNCPVFAPCTRSFLDDICRSLNNTINAGEITFNPADFAGHEDLLSSVFPA
jgi:hypothetical protein